MLYQYYFQPHPRVRLFLCISFANIIPQKYLCILTLNCSCLLVFFSYSRILKIRRVLGIFVKYVDKWKNMVYNVIEI